jgi:hypothetical protein
MPLLSEDTGSKKKTTGPSVYSPNRRQPSRRYRRPHHGDGCARTTLAIKAARRTVHCTPFLTKATTPPGKSYLSLALDPLYLPLGNAAADPQILNSRYTISLCAIGFWNSYSRLVATVSRWLKRLRRLSHPPHAIPWLATTAPPLCSRAAAKGRGVRRPRRDPTLFRWGRRGRASWGSTYDRRDGRRRMWNSLSAPAVSHARGYMSSKVCVDLLNVCCSSCRPTTTKRPASPSIRAGERAAPSRRAPEQEQPASWSAATVDFHLQIARPRTDVVATSSLQRQRRDYLLLFFFIES